MKKGMNTESEMNTDQRIQMLEVRTSQLRKSLSDLEVRFADQSQAVAELNSATRDLRESVEAMNKMVQGHTRDVRTVDAHLSEILERLGPEGE